MNSGLLLQTRDPSQAARMHAVENADQHVLEHFHRHSWTLVGKMLSRPHKPSQGTDGMCVRLHFPDTHSIKRCGCAA